MFPIKYKIRILNLMFLPKDSVRFEGQYYSNWIFPMHIDTICMELSIVYSEGHGYNSLNHDVYMSVNIIFMLANSGSVV